MSLGDFNVDILDNIILLECIDVVFCVMPFVAVFSLLGFETVEFVLGQLH